MLSWFPPFVWVDWLARVEDHLAWSEVARLAFLFLEFIGASDHVGGLHFRSVRVVVWLTLVVLAAKVCDHNKG